VDYGSNDDGGRGDNQELILSKKMIMSMMNLRSAMALAFVAMGCSAGSGGMAGQAQDIAQYNQLQMQLDTARTIAIQSTIANPMPSGNRLYFLDTSTFAPTLHRYDDTSGARLDYGFSIGDGDTYNFRASANTIVTAVPNNGVTYTAYDASQPNHAIDTTNLDMPSDGSKWYAYATDANKVYLIVPNQDANGNHVNEVQQWIPGSAPTVLTTLEAAGVAPGSVLDFDVFNNQMIVIDSGALWRLDLATLKATSLGNMTIPGNSLEIDQDGVIFSAASTSLLFYRYSDGKTLDVSNLIKSASYQLNTTFNTIHYWSRDFARYKDWIVYVSNSGVFAYDLMTQVVKPILLSPLSMTTINYASPSVLDDGTLLIIGVPSNDAGRGPTYKIDLTKILQ
jgi:hypothetical protein